MRVRLLNEALYLHIDVLLSPRPEDILPSPARPIAPVLPPLFVPWVGLVWNQPPLTLWLVGLPLIAVAIFLG